MTVQEFVKIDKDLQTVQDISDVKGYWKIPFNCQIIDNLLLC
jgi:hypothetical protein